MKRYFILYEFLSGGTMFTRAEVRKINFTRAEVRKINFARVKLAEVEAKVAKDLNVSFVQIKACNRV